MDIENPKIEFCSKHNKTCLKFTFHGKLLVEDSRKAVDIWKKAFESKANEKIILIWDCLKMSGYDPGSRNEWQNAIKVMKNQIDSIWLITNSNLIKVGATVIGIVTSLKINVVNSEDKIILS